MEDLEKMRENIIKSIKLENLYKNTHEWPNAAKRIAVLNARLEKVEKAIKERTKDKVIDAVKFLVKAYVAIR